MSLQLSFCRLGTTASDCCMAISFSNAMSTIAQKEINTEQVLGWISPYTSIHESCYKCVNTLILHGINMIPNGHFEQHGTWSSTRFSQLVALRLHLNRWIAMISDGRRRSPLRRFTDERLSGKPGQLPSSAF
uniref:Uncharacterized protein n=1 Tax=Coccidioides posadasii RMSCC 3488 TaxID=454284 RepID=A0A0J6FA59_COCPO|nr:hypothetical protein CPAG_06248 [Coccidioides posadasii RMSCC 3488]